MSSLIPLVKAHLVDVLLPAVLPADVTVYYGLGYGGTDRDVVMVTDAQTDSEFPCYGTTRKIEERGQVAVVFKSYRPTEQGQREATERAFALHDLVRDHFRAAPNETLGGAVRMASITSTELVEDDETVDEDDLAAGRLAVVVAVLSFTGRT